MTREGCWVIVGVAMVLATTAGRCVAGAQQPDDRVLQLSRMVISEAGYSPGRETFAILNVLEWRRTHLPAFAGWDIVRMGRAYCSGFGGRRHTENPHVRTARSLRIEQIPADIARDVSSFLAGSGPPSPCPSAVHWAARGLRRGAWSGLRVRCSVPVQNDYFGGEP